MEEKFYYVKGKDGNILLSVGLFKTNNGYIRTCAMRSPRDQNNKKLAREILRTRAINRFPRGKEGERKHYNNEFRHDCFQRLVNNVTAFELVKLLHSDSQDVHDSQFVKIHINPIFTPFEAKILGIEN